MNNVRAGLNALSTCQLAPPTIFKESHGAFHIDFTTPNVFDLSSDWVAHGSNGKFSGGFRTNDGDGIDLIHKISGSCKMSRGVTTVKQRILIGGTVGGGDEYNSVSNFEGTMVGYGVDATLGGTTVTKVCLRFDLGPFSKRKTIVCDVSRIDNQMWSHDGRWAIRLEFDHVGKKLTGTANVYVAEFNADTAKQYATTVTGKLDPDGEANFKPTTASAARSSFAPSSSPETATRHPSSSRSWRSAARFSGRSSTRCTRGSEDDRRLSRSAPPQERSAGSTSVPSRRSESRSTSRGVSNEPGTTWQKSSPRSRSRPRRSRTCARGPAMPYQSRNASSSPCACAEVALVWLRMS
jgi:hypothetical protein